jgi:hypothetical protein
MSTTPPVPAPQPAPSGGGSNKLLLGCGIGCGVIVIVLAILAGVVYAKLIKPAAEAAQEIERIQAENKAAVETIEGLDAAHPSRLAEDLDTASPTAEDLARYVAAREALAEPCADVARVRAELAEVFDMGRLASGGPGAMSAAFGMVGNMFGAMKDLEVARGALLQRAAEVLDENRLGPTELSRMLELVEWRFLQRPEAVSLALTASERGDWHSQRFQASFSRSLLEGAGAQMSSGDRAQMERQLEEAEDRLDELEAAAAERTALSAAARSLLAGQATRLEALPSEGVAELGMLTESVNPFEGMEGGPFGR